MPTFVRNIFKFPTAPWPWGRLSP